MANSLSSVYSDQREAGAKLQKTFLIPIEAIQCDWDENIRPRNEEHIETWKDTMRKSDYVPPVLVEMRDGVPHVIEGFHRYTAKRELVVNEKHEDYLLLCAEWKGSLADKLITMRNSTHGLPLTYLEDAEVILEVKTAGGYTAEQLAQRLGISRTAVNDKVLVAEACDEIKDMIRDEQISATMARDFIVKHGVDALAHIKRALERANKKGKARVTARVGGTKQFSAAKARAVLELLAAGLDYENFALNKDKLGDGDVDITLTLDKQLMEELVDILEDYVEHTEEK